MQTHNNAAEFDKLQSGTGTWSSLDIFLFGNGQKYSPPRKYNLRGSELHLWDATLNYLARSQYGPKHTNIELYSIDGQKIGGPLELRNGSAYVAVQPPDAFVQSGYEKYLVKATRSWEKRQEKRTSDSALSKPVSDKVNASKDIIQSTDNNDSTNIKIIQDIRIQPGTTAASTAQDQTVITVKPNSVSKAKSNSVTSTIKQTSKRKSSVSQQRPSILRKNYANTISPLAHKGSRDSRITKVDPLKKKPESSSKRADDVDLLGVSNGSLITTKITESKLEKETVESTKKIDSSVTVIQPTGRNESIDKNVPVTTTMPLTIPLFNSTVENKPIEIDMQTDGVVEKDIFSVSFHSEENFQSICINANNSVKENIPIPINDPTQAVLNSTPNIVSHQSNFGHNQFTLPPSTNDRVSQKNYVVSDSQTAENIIISISPGDTLKLKLSIAFENHSNSTDAHKNEIDPQLKQSSVLLTTKSDLANPGRHTLEVHIPSTSANTYENIEEELNDAKLAVCGCNCNLNSDKVFSTRVTPVYVDNNNYFILLPSVNNREKINSCNCEQENPKRHFEQDERHLILSNIASNAAESASIKVNRLPISTTHSQISECECPIAGPSTAKNQTSTLECNQLSNIEASKCCTCDDDDEPYRNTSDSILRVSSTNNPKTLSDNSTQTNWNNILLEARLHKDGHYTLHMPPLDKIKL